MKEPKVGDIVEVREARYSLYTMVGDIGIITRLADKNGVLRMKILKSPNKNMKLGVDVPVMKGKIKILRHQSNEERIL